MEKIFTKERHDKMILSSMNHWFPKIENKGFLYPKTKFYRLSEADLKSGIDCFTDEINERIVKKILEDKWEFPLFIRTDMSSEKHDFKDTCYVESEENLKNNLCNLVSGNRAIDFIGIPFNSIVVREFIELDWKFKAFWGEMPVAPEVRVFVKNGEFQCIHPYWILDSILKATIENWEEILIEMHMRASLDYGDITHTALKFNKLVEGYWSVDFALSRDQKWHLIDAAEGDVSYHYPHNIDKEGD